MACHLLDTKPLSKHVQAENYNVFIPENTSNNNSKNVYRHAVWSDRFVGSQKSFKVLGCQKESDPPSNKISLLIASM